MNRVAFGVGADEFHERFSLVEQIGVGGFAKVHRGVDKLTRAPVAVKEVDKTRYISSDSSLEREVYILSEVQHENIIGHVCTYVTPTTVFIVTELADGGELLERVVNVGNFSEDVARNLVQQILRGVEYLHARNIVHRDLKNILLSDTSSSAIVKIADFGLARFFADDSELRTICGSPLYVAPEILDVGADMGAYTPAVDMWSVGVILYILLSGNSPFDNEDEQVLFQKIRSADYSLDDYIWEHVSADAKDCVKKLLTVDTASRMTVSQALQHPWILGSCVNPDLTLPRQLCSVKQKRLARQLESFRVLQEERRLTMKNTQSSSYESECTAP